MLVLHSLEYQKIYRGQCVCPHRVHKILKNPLSVTTEAIPVENTKKLLQKSQSHFRTRRQALVMFFSLCFWLC
ncbi:hypothetical protein B9Q11_03575 [Candidatus Marsarchaeota G2 archaeon ECH_B_SAG-F08]|uniref:Uncharacterized protein n=2 Tax=Candidatus Marsarchaeota TaxID=1978152 RepID=A0A2R6ACZ1_9ARCH|nr:MAG: hypothetical protein B9Q02_09725 [Candidatus Marsarchaeota G1 archaeon BE_D]PSN97728.1 MAG: hypothetical protein B9Q11_03575 [Candidatus Marsarchaeota G2 archaeon ECH_B_SAG-F08]